jgi:hypothetical protein
MHCDPLAQLHLALAHLPLPHRPHAELLLSALRREIANWQQRVAINE